MSAILPAVSYQQADQNYQEVYDWLHAQAEALGLQVTLLADEATLRHGWLYLPAHIDGVLDAYDNALKLQKLEDTWNDRVPQPEPPLFLVPARDPLRKAAWEKIANAMQRKIQAVDAFGKAANRSEQEEAASEFQSAEQAEKEASLAYEHLMPWGERIS